MSTLMTKPALICAVLVLATVGALAQTPSAPNLDSSTRINGVPLSAYIQQYITGGAVVNPQEVSLSGTATIPNGNTHVCAAPGAVLTLPSSAITGTTSQVQDCSGGAGTQPITVNPSSDAAITEQSPYKLIVPHQATGFRKVSANTWQPY